MIISIQQASRLVEACMMAVGHSEAEAGIIAHHLIDCELRGVPFGGLARALSIAERARNPVLPRRPISVLRETPLSAVLDGGQQVGYLVARRATEIAIDKARISGMAVVAASKTWYTGMFSYYLEMVTAAGFAGIVAGSGGQLAAPFGGTEPRLSTNPVAMGFPSGTAPVIWDIGTSAVMLADVMLKQRLGETLPEGLAFDAEGRPTRDPAAALGGAFTVWGGHRGSGLSMAIQLLGMMAGQASEPPSLEDCGYLIVVIDPALVTDADDFQRRVASFAHSIRATRPVDASEPVRVPFDRSLARRKATLAAGRFEVPDVVHAALQDIAQSRPAGARTH